MSLSEVLDEYQISVTAWLDQARKALAAVQKLQKAVAGGNLRDVEKLRQAAVSAADTAAQRAADCPPLAFDAAAYLEEGGTFIPELLAAAEKTGLQLAVRDGVIFCFPVLARPEPELAAVRIDRRLEPSVRPEVLVAFLKKAQSADPKARPERFIETLFEAYELVRAQRRLNAYIDLPLVKMYSVLTLLPGSDKEYTLLDFLRDIYFLDVSGRVITRKGFHMSLTASTVSRERSIKVLKFVTRDGYEKDFAAVKFTPPA